MGNTTKNKTILFAAGGTGGHIYPAVAVANKCKSISEKLYNLRIEFVGCYGRIEEKIIPREGYKLNLIWISSLQRGFSLKSIIKNFSLPFKIAASFWQAYRLLSRIKPDVVVCAGSAVSLPVGKVALFKKIPLVLMESNALPGLAVKKLESQATQIHLAFKAASKHLSSKNILISGNPIREVFFEFRDKQKSQEHFGLKNDDMKSPVILVFGGSQGAKSINMAIEKISDELIAKGVKIIWQTGGNFQASGNGATQISNENVYRSEYIYEMDLAYSAADLVIARAGATTISELSAVGKPSVLVPLPTAAEDHQRINAEAFAGLGAAEFVLDKNLSYELKDKILGLLNDTNKLNDMAAKARSNMVLGADEIIAKHILEL